jgi:hypothetical protein
LQQAAAKFGRLAQHGLWPAPGSQLPPEGAVLEGGEEGIHLGEGGAVCRRQPVDGVDAADEFALESDRRNRNLEAPYRLEIQARLCLPVLSFCDLLLAARFET